MILPPSPGCCVRCHIVPIPVVGSDGKLVPLLIDGVCWFCRTLPEPRKPDVVRPGG